jgi:hypothetical protein
MRGSDTDRARQAAWTTAGLILLALGSLLLAVGAIGVGADGGGLAFLALGLPPVAAGGLILRRVSGARVAGLSVSLAYAAVIASVATAPWRGLSPPPGAESPSIDPASVLIGLTFGVAAGLLAFGTSRRQPRVS